ncbi:MAG: MFS transporter [Solirubrobacterales bacterium]|nr:MFS transporter [Solirubrobacterales bacterium]
MDAKQGALVAAILGSVVVSVDATVVNVALPAITDDLGGGLSGQQWVVNAYLLTLAALILVSGSLADLFGERRIFTLGVVGFGVTSVLCAAAPSIEVLVAARALQGVSGALLTPAALAILIAVFPTAERGRAIGTWTAWGGIGILLGPLLGGQIVDSTSWRVVFAINVPIVLGTLALAARYVPEGTRGAGPRPHVDARGAVLAALGLAGPTFALIQQPQYGWGSPGVLVPLLGGLVLLGAFLRHEARAREPMLPLGLFARPNFCWGNVETLVMYAGIALFGFFVGLFLQQVAGYSALKAGTIGLVPTGMMFVLSRRFGALADRFGPRLFMGVGPLFVALGFLAMLRLDESVAFASDLLPALILFGLGLSITVSPLTAAVLADADESNAGIASAVNNAIARTAGLLATAGVGAVLAASYASGVSANLEGARLSSAGSALIERAKERALNVPDVSALPAADRGPVVEATRAAAIDAFHLGMVIAAVLLTLGGLAGLLKIRNPDPCETKAADCAGGQLAGAPQSAARGEAERAPAPA